MVEKIKLSDLRAAITKADQKATASESGDVENRQLQSLLRAANEKLKSAEQSVTRAEQNKTNAEDKLSPPPTKQIQGDGKKAGSKTVVDEAEKDKLQAQVKAAEVQIQQAQASVESAREEAQKLTADSLNNANLTDQQKQQMDQLTTQIASLTTDSTDASKLETEDFQNKFKDTIEKIQTLGTALPDKSNEGLETFWKKVSADMKLIEGRYITATTPAAYDLTQAKEDNNFNGFFEDFNTAIDTLAGNTNGSMRSNVIGLKARINANRETFLDGSTDQDITKYETLMNTINGLNNSFARGREVTNADFIKLDTDATAANNVMTRGGSASGAVIGRFLLDSSTNLNALVNGYGDNIDPGLKFDMQNLATQFATLGMTPERFIGSSSRAGLSKAEGNDLKDIFTNFAEAVSDNPRPDASSLAGIVGEASLALEELLGRYPAVVTSGSGSNSGTGGTGGGTSSGGSTSSAGGASPRGGLGISTRRSATTTASRLASGNGR